MKKISKKVQILQKKFNIHRKTVKFRVKVCKIKFGKYASEHWTLTVDKNVIYIKNKHAFSCSLQNWRNVWNGKIEVFYPMGHIAHLRNQFKSINTYSQSYDDLKKLSSSFWYLNDPLMLNQRKLYVKLRPNWLGGSGEHF